jgi:hypothetical protein
MCNNDLVHFANRDRNGADKQRSERNFTLKINQNDAQLSAVLGFS